MAKLFLIFIKQNTYDNNKTDQRQRIFKSTDF